MSAEEQSEGKLEGLGMALESLDGDTRREAIEEPALRSLIEDGGV